MNYYQFGTLFSPVGRKWFPAVKVGHLGLVTEPAEASGPSWVKQRPWQCWRFRVPGSAACPRRVWPWLRGARRAWQPWVGRRPPGSKLRVPRTCGHRGSPRTVPESLSLPPHGQSCASAALRKAQRFSDIAPPPMQGGGGGGGGRECRRRRNPRPGRAPSKQHLSVGASAGRFPRRGRGRRGGAQSLSASTAATKPEGAATHRGCPAAPRRFAWAPPGPDQERLGRDCALPLQLTTRRLRSPGRRWHGAVTGVFEEDVRWGGRGPCGQGTGPRFRPF